jgi:hypothetical protein
MIKHLPAFRLSLVGRIFCGKPASTFPENAPNRTGGG